MKAPISDKEAIIRTIKEDTLKVNLSHINMLLELLVSESHRHLESCTIDELREEQGRIKAYRGLLNTFSEKK
jgi:hypothetical protein